jgi:hypothetical protein
LAVGASELGREVERKRLLIEALEWRLHKLENRTLFQRIKAVFFK